jgi:hypothetical protein
MTIARPFRRSVHVVPLQLVTVLALGLSGIDSGWSNPRPERVLPVSLDFQVIWPDTVPDVAEVIDHHAFGDRSE